MCKNRFLRKRKDKDETQEKKKMRMKIRYKNDKNIKIHINTQYKMREMHGTSSISDTKDAGMCRGTRRLTTARDDDQTIATG